MAKSLNWKQSEDVRDTIHILVQAFVEGNLVALPAETAYHVVASALNPAAVGALFELSQQSKVLHPTVFLRSAQEALDYSPKMSQVARRAVSRGWPGPLVLELPVDSKSSLADQLPASTRVRLLQEDRFLAQRVAAHSAIVEAMKLMPGPLVAAACVDESGKAICDGVQALERVGDDVAFLVDDGKTHYGDFATTVRVEDSVCTVINDGVLKSDKLDSLFQLAILIVCTGNTCRSPMAEVLLTKLVQDSFPRAFEQGRSPVFVGSAGLSAFPGGQASVEAQVAMRKRDLNLAEHQSRPVSERLLSHADLILTMTNSHRRAIVQELPHLAGKVHLLSGATEDVSDPFGGTQADYAACADQIERYLKNWVQQIEPSWFPSWKTK